MIKSMFRSMRENKDAQRTSALMRRLKQQEAHIGGQVFGPVAPGQRREFFCLDEHTWIWHEEWTDQNGQYQIRTTRYDVRPDGIVKSQDGAYTTVSLEEAHRLVEAAKLYQQRVKREIYGLAA